MATWKETSVLGEHCDGVGCSGRGGGCSGEAGGDKEGREGNGGTWRAHPGRPGHCWQQHPPPLGALDVWGGAEQWAAVTQ